LNEPGNCDNEQSRHRDGAGGHFTIRAHATRTVRVRTNAEGIAIAPSFITNHTAGGYTVGVRAGARRVAFALVNR